MFIKGVFDNTPNDPQSGTIVRRNLMVNCNECLTISDSRDSRVSQNIIRDARIGVNLLGREADPLFHPIGDWLVNNTIDKMTSACIFVGGGPYHSNVRVWNNVMTNCAYANYRDGASTFSASNAVIDWEHNNYNIFTNFAEDGSGRYTFAHWRTTIAHDGAAPASLTTSPMYANAAADDYRLGTAAGAPHASCAGVSPSRSLGVDILDLDDDGSVTDVIPAGAYRSNAEVIGPDGIAAPSAPTGLRITPSDL